MRGRLCMVIESMKPSTYTVKFTAPMIGIQAIGWGQYSHIVNLELVNLRKSCLIPYSCIFEEN